MAICKGIFNEYTQNKMSELTLLKTQLVAKIADEEANNIKSLQVEMLMEFFHKSVLAIECAEDPTNLDKRKKLFDALIKEIIFDGEKYLIVLKTSNMPNNPTTDEQKEKSRAECDELRTRFETLRFGDPDGNRTHDTTVKGWCLNRLTTGPFKLVYFITVLWVCQAYEREFSRGIDFWR